MYSGLAPGSCAEVIVTDHICVQNSYHGMQDIEKALEGEEERKFAKTLCRALLIFLEQ